VVERLYETRHFVVSIGPNRCDELRFKYNFLVSGYLAASRAIDLTPSNDIG